MIVFYGISPHCDRVRKDNFIHILENNFVKWCDEIKYSLNLLLRKYLDSQNFWHIVEIEENSLQKSRTRYQSSRTLSKKYIHNFSCTLKLFSRLFFQMREKLLVFHRKCSFSLVQCNCNLKPAQLVYLETWIWFHGKSEKFAVNSRTDFTFMK